MRRLRRATVLVAAAAVVLAVAGALAAARGVGGKSRVVAREATAARVSTTATTAPATTTTTVPDTLVSYGATFAQWQANHTEDPDSPGNGYWPRLPSGLDTYASVTFIGGKALRYLENIYPAETLHGAILRVEDELPPAPSILARAQHPSCYELLFSSRRVLAMTGVNVLAVLESGGPSFDPQSVTTITYSPLPPGAGLPPSC